MLLNMKKLFVIIILSLSFITSSKTDDIKDFEIDGISLGESLLNYYSEKEIKKFCETNFNITFPMTSKYDVKGDNAHQIYLWAKHTYGNSSIPKWNFHKILINKNGNIEETYASFTNPKSKRIIKKIEQIL